MKVFHHNDADGACAAYILRDYFEKNNESSEYIRIDYTDEFPVDSIGNGEEVWIVDFSVKPEIMCMLFEKTPNVFWIDHHRSAIDEYTNSDLISDGIVPGLRSSDFAGCELVWLYLYKLQRGHDVKIDPGQLNECPEFIRLIGDYDTWKFEFGDRTRNFQEAYKGHGCPGPENEWWRWCAFQRKLEAEIENGKFYRDHTKTIYDSIRDGYAYETKFAGYNILVCNAPIFTSQLFGDKVKDYPFVAVCCRTKGKWKTSLYSENMDVIDIAKDLGGGGHPRACGFISDEYPFE